jgi:hypothetical protein
MVDRITWSVGRREHALACSYSYGLPFGLPNAEFSPSIQIDVNWEIILGYHLYEVVPYVKGRETPQVSVSSAVRRRGWSPWRIAERRRNDPE